MVFSIFCYNLITFNIYFAKRGSNNGKLSSVTQLQPKANQNLSCLRGVVIMGNGNELHFVSIKTRNKTIVIYWQYFDGT
jgi:hypothetical protein